ncbi:hypothetical protein TWF730_010059 [Orbilia blumenaviensis]|uniref:F-box domain-containing protein n=1 Tax=Orbilia blumenaviensis TaxID=1796055 RepID=A0AAV9UTU6_9PEZI
MDELISQTEAMDLSSPRCYLLECPHEIILEIMEYVDDHWHRSSLKRFARTSKGCRLHAFPVLFAGLWLSHESVIAFSEGGSLYSLRSSIRTLYVSQRRTRRGKVYHSRNLLEILTSVARSLPLFSSATKLCIPCGFGVPKYTMNNLHVALWRAISNVPNLKHITLNNILGYLKNRKYPGSDPDQYSYYRRSLHPEARDFLGHEKILDSDLSGKIVFSTQSFETVDLTVSSLDLPKEPIFFSSSFFFAFSSQTLRSINLNISRAIKVLGSSDDPVTIRFPNVKRIQFKGEMSFHSTHGEVISWFAQSCPNTESFNFRPRLAQSVGLLPSDYKLFTLLTKLKDLSVPWPRNDTKRYKQEKLNDLIRELIDEGLQDLKTIAFARAPPWCAYSNAYILKDCRIERVGPGYSGVKIWWKQTCRHFGANLRDDPRYLTETAEEGDSGDDLDECPPKGAYLSREWMLQHQPAEDSVTASA